ncbi:MAG TPA: hypothetical protein VFG19_02590 [Geobacteraceae bacterium]|nr:hypothetical protein [Geobacteraceae bacterium]
MKTGLVSLFALLQLCIIGFIAVPDSALSAPVQLSTAWKYDSMDGSDYRSISNGDLIVTIPAKGVVARTFPPYRYSINDDFAVSIYFSDYSHQGPNTNQSSTITSNAGISINWFTGKTDPIHGDELLGNLSVWRGSWSIDDSEHYLSIYGINNRNYAQVVSLQEIGMNDSSGFLRITKQGDKITTMVTDSLGQTYSWNYTVSGLNITGNDIMVGIDTSNGPYDFTTVRYSRLDMTTPSAVPLPASVLLFSPPFAGFFVVKRYRKKSG